MIASTADKDKNRLDTGTLGWKNIDNKADFTAEHSGGSIGTGGTIGSQLVTNAAGGLLSNANNSGHAEGTTKSAISDGSVIVRNEDKQKQDINKLNRDTEHANDGSINPIFDKEKLAKNELAPIENKITHTRIELISFVTDHFTSLIRQVKGTDLATFNDFYENEIGAEGIVLNTKIETEFSRQCQSISSGLHRISLDFDNEIARFETSVGADLAVKGISSLKNIKLNNTHILAARDGIVSVGKMIGVDLAKYMKFKPWGAVNFAAKANAAIAVAGLVLEAWDSYKKAQEEAKFRDLVKEIVSMLETQRKGLLEALNDKDFIHQLFPAYQALQENLNLVMQANESSFERKKSFDEWQNEGAIIEGEYRVITASYP
ncbi:LeoA/HP0731 family dynamin-like GTPase [Proteus mirabilis]|uniref:LeoA/HP0731 family dynamin-like GTPase n=1 Tax=Proteus mirabilis TaxID=584 RepID=UPI0039B4CB4B